MLKEEGKQWMYARSFSFGKGGNACATSLESRESKQIWEDKMVNAFFPPGASGSAPNGRNGSEI